jgi:hypothetical protein
VGEYSSVVSLAAFVILAEALDLCISAHGLFRVCQVFLRGNGDWVKGMGVIGSACGDRGLLLVLRGGGRG